MKFLAHIVSISLVLGTNIQVPLTSDLRGHPIVEVDINGSDPSHHSLILSLGRLTRVYGRFTRTEPGWTILISNTTLSVVDPLVLFSTLGFGRGHGEIGIGPNSPLFRTYESLAVLKNTSHPLQLVVRSTDENFATFCVDGSLTRMRLDVFPDNRIRGAVQFASDRIPTTTGAVLIVDEAVSGSMLSLSYSLAENVRDRLTLAGAIANGPSSFTNCTHLLDELTLTLFVNTRIGGLQLSQIRFFPDDYITRDSVANTCSFHIAGTTPMFNPLLVPGMNVRLGNSADEGYRFLEICDTSL